MCISAVPWSTKDAAIPREIISTDVANIIHTIRGVLFSISPTDLIIVVVLIYLFIKYVEVLAMCTILK